ncbi:MAG: bacillithiol biosynthesis deacetylase BshB1 [Saprospiraceae bacterium]|nr:bacillithiol biosynthesis deacetylase BshB1 [Saprospiraceae bacterium]
MEKVDILAIGAHPDDVELGCAGILLAHRDLGYRIGLLDLTRGELGTRGDAPTRTREAIASAARMGAVFRRQLDLPDGFFREDEASLKAIIREIRDARPAIILANAVRDRHPDHARGAGLVARAAYLSGLPKIITTREDGTNQEPWRPRAVYHYIQDYHVEPDIVVNITPWFAEKIALVQTFRSQFYDPDSRDPATPISGRDFLDFLEARARDLGRPAGYLYAEGLVSARAPGVRDLLALD